MSLMQIVQEVTTLKREIDQQTAMLDSFVKSNREHIDYVKSELQGSKKGYDLTMLSSLSQAETTLAKAQVALARASDALERVSLV